MSPYDISRVVVEVVEPGVVIVTIGARPMTTNAVRRMVPRQRARIVDEWHAAIRPALSDATVKRGAGCPWLSPPVLVTAEASYPSRRHLPDTDAIQPAAKIVVDAIVDVGWLPDDTGETVAEVRLRAPHVRRGLGAPYLVVTVAPARVAPDVPRCSSCGLWTDPRRAHITPDDRIVCYDCADDDPLSKLAPGEAP